MNKKISLHTLYRLCDIYDFLDNLDDNNGFITSKRLGERLNIASDTVRKDISMLGEVGKTASGYEIKKLKNFLSKKLKIDNEIRLCVVGLGKIGRFLLNYEKFNSGNFKLLAGFDKSINKLETINTKIELFTVYDMEKIIMDKRINFAVICVPSIDAQKITDRLIESGIIGILNFSQVYLKTKNKNVIVHNIDFAGEFRKIISEAVLKKNFFL
ncbi:MAG: redox-sensing transcriptional repressor Rex [Spirochaetes bacterium]|nr:redox-sensing transcriptional repressor Rex [Spirochaetota bacterium]